MKKIFSLLIILVLINLSIYAQEKKKKYVDIVSKDFKGVKSIRWGVGYKEIKGLKYVGSMGHAGTIYENRNLDFGYLSSSIYKKKNTYFGFFKDRFYYMKIVYENPEEAENDLNAVRKVYGQGRPVKTKEILIAGERRKEFRNKNIQVIFSILKDETSLRFINRDILNEKNKYVEKSWDKKNSIEGWKFLNWDMNLREVKSLLTTNDKDYMKWGWEFSPLNKSILIGNNFYETKNNYFMKIRNNRTLKCYKIHDIKKIFFLNEELFCVMINFNEIERDKKIESLKKEFGEKVKIDEFDNLIIKTAGTEIYLNNNTLYYLDRSKSRTVLSQIEKENEKI